MSKQDNVSSSPLIPIIKINIIVLCICGLSLALLMSATYLSNILLLIGSSVLMAYILLGPVELTQLFINKVLFKNNTDKNSASKVFSIILVYVLFGLILISTAIKFLPQLSHQIQDFSNDLPRYYEQLGERINQYIPGLIEKTDNLEPTGSEEAQTALNQAVELIQTYSSGLLKYLYNIGTTTLTTLVYWLTGMVMVFYFLLDGSVLKSGAIQILPNRFQEQVSNYLVIVHRVMYYFIRIQLIMGIAAGIYLYILLSLYDFKYALLLAVIYGITSIVPVIGPWFGLIPTFIVAFFKPDPTIIIPISLFVGAFFLFKVYWLLPKGLNYKFGIHPVIIILTFLACVQIAGPWGIIMAFPLASLIAGSYAYSQGKLSKV